MAARFDVLDLPYMSQAERHSLLIEAEPKAVRHEDEWDAAWDEDALLTLANPYYARNYLEG